MTPDEPLSAFQEGATALHELFITLTKQGFNEGQALRIIGVMLANAATGGGGE